MQTQDRAVSRNTCFGSFDSASLYLEQSRECAIGDWSRVGSVQLVIASKNREWGVARISTTGCRLQCGRQERERNVFYLKKPHQHIANTNNVTKYEIDAERAAG